MQGARRDHHDALGELEQLEHVGPEGSEASDSTVPDFYRPRGRGRRVF